MRQSVDQIKISEAMVSENDDDGGRDGRVPPQRQPYTLAQSNELYILPAISFFLLFDIIFIRDTTIRLYQHAAIQCPHL